MCLPDDITTLAVPFFLLLTHLTFLKSPRSLEQESAGIGRSLRECKLLIASGAVKFVHIYKDRYRM